MEFDDSHIRVQRCVKALLEKGMTPQQISAALDHRVSWRTIYRWARGEHAPRQKSHLTALEALVAERT